MGHIIQELRASPRTARGMLVSSHLKSPNIENDLEFEWLLCLASTLMASKRTPPKEAGKAKGPQEFPEPKAENS